MFNVLNLVIFMHDRGIVFIAAVAKQEERDSGGDWVSAVEAPSPPRSEGPSRRGVWRSNAQPIEAPGRTVSPSVGSAVCARSCNITWRKATEPDHCGPPSCSDPVWSSAAGCLPGYVPRGCRGAAASDVGCCQGRSSPEHDARIEISDAGFSMPLEVVPPICEPFTPGAGGRSWQERNPLPRGRQRSSVRASPRRTSCITQRQRLLPPCAPGPWCSPPPASDWRSASSTPGA